MFPRDDPLKEETCNVCGHVEDAGSARIRNDGIGLELASLGPSVLAEQESWTRSYIYLTFAVDPVGILFEEERALRAYGVVRAMCRDPPVQDMPYWSDMKDGNRRVSSEQSTVREKNVITLSTH